MQNTQPTLIDCTLRDGGYYNNWDFSLDLIQQYLSAMSEIAESFTQQVGGCYVELGTRALETDPAKGICAQATDEFLASLEVPSNLKVALMIYGKELAKKPLEEALEILIPNSKQNSPVDLVRIACSAAEFEATLPAVTWLKERGYQVGFNLIDITKVSEKEIKRLASLAASYPIDALYFADSRGSLTPQDTLEIIGWIRESWQGALGIHTHDNLGLALSNSLSALGLGELPLERGVSWIDATVTGMGRGPGNALTEEVVIELAERLGAKVNLEPLMNLIAEHFKPMQQNYGWGKNPYYYLSGKYGIHPSFVQDMLTQKAPAQEVLDLIEKLRDEKIEGYNPEVLTKLKAG